MHGSSISKIHHIVGVVAGKGGVGKSTVAVNLALALKKLGFKVGLLDADIYGPSIKRMLGVKGVPKAEGGRILSVDAFGIKVMSMAFFKQGEKANAVRAPIANAIITQFLMDVEWGELDYLIVDFPPGTGDIPLTMMQKVALSCAILVSTPQKVAIEDVKKAKEMLMQMNVPILGVVENMSYYRNAYGEIETPFGRGAIKDLECPVLVNIGMESALSLSQDEGRSIFEEEVPLECVEKFFTLATTLCDLTQEGISPHLALLDDTRFSLTFYDQMRYDFTTDQVQRACPCVRCSLKKRQNEGAVKIEQIDWVGTYALKIKFSSGCSNGIYPLQYLKTLH